METKKKDHHDQAEELRSILNEVNQQQIEENLAQPENNQSNFDADSFHDISVLNLPPRKEVHGDKKKRTHFKITKPFIRLAIVVLLLAVLVILFILGDGLEFF